MQACDEAVTFFWKLWNDRRGEFVRSRSHMLSKRFQETLDFSGIWFECVNRNTRDPKNLSSCLWRRSGRKNWWIFLSNQFSNYKGSQHFLSQCQSLSGSSGARSNCSIVLYPSFRWLIKSLIAYFEFWGANITAMGKLIDYRHGTGHHDGDALITYIQGVWDRPKAVAVVIIGWFGGILLLDSTSGAARLRWHRRCLGDQMCCNWKSIHRNVLHVEVHCQYHGLTDMRADVLSRGPRFQEKVKRIFLKHARKPWNHAHKP